MLDLCCGSGYGTRILLAERAPRCTGVDMRRAPRSSSAAGDRRRRPRLSFERADALEYLERPLAEDFDAIVLLEGLEHLPEPDRALEALRRHADGRA